MTNVDGVGGSLWMMLPLSDPTCPRRARDWAARQVREWPMPRVVAVLRVVDELLANAYLSGRPPYLARIAVAGDGRSVLVEVSHAGNSPVLGAIERRLQLVSSTTSDWGVRVRRSRTAVWARLPRAAAAERVPAPRVRRTGGVT